MTRRGGPATADAAVPEDESLEIYQLRRAAQHNRRGSISRGCIPVMIDFDVDAHGT